MLQDNARLTNRADEPDAAIQRAADELHQV